MFWYMEGWPGLVYLTCAVIAFSAYHFIPRHPTDLERKSIYKLFGTLGPGPILVFLIRFFGTDHLLLVALLVAVKNGIIEPHQGFLYVLLAMEMLIATLSVMVSFVIWRSRKAVQAHCEGKEN